jgi:hypothetical protein
MSSNRWIRAALLAAGGIVVAMRGARAQRGPGATPAPISPQSVSCIEAIPDSALVPAVVYLHASELAELDSTARARVEEIDLFTQLVAERYRALLHAAPGALPAGEPALSWRTRERGVRVVVDRDGGFVAHPLAPDENLRVLAAGQRSTPLVAALDSVRAYGEPLAFVAGPADSVVFSLMLSDARFGADGKLVPSSVRVGFPVATLRVPREEQVRTARMSPPRYPERPRTEHFEATIIMQFVVDTTGRVDPATIHDVWPASLPPLTAYRKAVYEEFLRAVLASLQGAVFEPARVGGCVVRQLVQQPFTFGLAR